MLPKASGPDASGNCLQAQAKERLADLQRAGPVGIDRQGQDRYRRTLARLSVPRNADVDDILIRDGHAVCWRRTLCGLTPASRHLPMLD